jgi:hypothetical protein
MEWSRHQNVSSPGSGHWVAILRCFYTGSESIAGHREVTGWQQWILRTSSTPNLRHSTHNSQLAPGLHRTIINPFKCSSIQRDLCFLGLGSMAMACMPCLALKPFLVGLTDGVLARNSAEWSLLLGQGSSNFPGWALQPPSRAGRQQSFAFLRADRNQFPLGIPGTSGTQSHESSLLLSHHGIWRPPRVVHPWSF